MPTTLVPESPLMSDDFNPWTYIASIDTMSDNSHYDMFHATDLARRVTLAHGVDSLLSLLKDCAEATSFLLAKKNAVYFVYVCIEMRLCERIKNAYKVEEARYGRYEKTMYEIFRK